MQGVIALFRDFYTADWFRANGSLAAPLYASEARQTGFVNDSAQYENNWSADLHLNVNFTLSIAQDFATSVQITTIEADASTTQE